MIEVYIKEELIGTLYPNTKQEFEKFLLEEDYLSIKLEDVQILQQKYEDYRLPTHFIVKEEGKIVFDSMVKNIEIKSCYTLEGRATMSQHTEGDIATIGFEIVKNAQ